MNGAHGLQIFDLTRLRRDRDAARDVHLGPGGRALRGLRDAATTWRSTPTAASSTAWAPTRSAGGLHILSLANPTNPTFAGSFAANGYIHDTQCVVYHGPDVAHQGKQICFAANSATSGGAGNDRLAIIDVTNKSAPTVIAQPTYAGLRVHPPGLADRGPSLLPGGRRAGRAGLRPQHQDLHVGSAGPRRSRLDRLPLGPTTAIDHNQFIKGHYSYQANYTAGLRILDLTNIAAAALSPRWRPSTSCPPTTTRRFNGCWGVYPFFASGTVIVSGHQRRPDGRPVRAAPAPRRRLRGRRGAVDARRVRHRQRHRRP